MVNSNTSYLCHSLYHKKDTVIVHLWKKTLIENPLINNWIESLVTIQTPFINIDFS